MPVGYRHGVGADARKKTHHSRKAFIVPERDSPRHSLPPVVWGLAIAKTKKRGSVYICPVITHFLRTAAAFCLLARVGESESALLAPPEEAASTGHQDHFTLAIRAGFFGFHVGILHWYFR
jgi:hypothetical protein